MDLSLEIIVNEQGDTHHLILRDQTTVGRTAQSRIQISEPYISTNHAVITQTDGDYYIEDRGSKNGTFLNGESVEGPQQIKEGDILRFGLAACKVVETQVSTSSLAGVSSGQGSVLNPVGPAAAVGGMAIAGAAVATAVGANLASGGSGNYEPVVSSTDPVSWNWDEGYKPGLITSFPFVKKAKERNKQEKATPTREPFYKRKNAKRYDPFASRA